MKNKLGLPAHLRMTTREFKAWKRRELRELEKAANKFNIASAWCPDNRIYEIQDHIRSMKRMMSVKNWGR